MKKQKIGFIVILLSSLFSCGNQESPTSSIIQSSLSSLESYSSDSSAKKDSSLQPSGTSSSSSKDSSALSQQGGSSSSSASSSQSSASSSGSSSSSSSSASSSSSSSSETSSPSVSSPILPPITDDNQITYYGMENVKIGKGQYFSPFKNVRIVYNDEDITSIVNVKGTVDYGTVGTYTLTYEIAFENKTVERQRKVEVTSNPITTSGNTKQYQNKKVTLGQGSYLEGDGSGLGFAPASPDFLAEDLLNKPVPTSSWWTTLLTSNYGGRNGIFTNPLRSSFQDDGVEVTNILDGFTQYWTDESKALSVAQFSVSPKELLVKADSLATSYQTKVIDYSENAVKVSTRNPSSNVDEMVVTYAQGSPYIFFEFNERDGSVRLPMQGITRAFEYYDLNGNKLDDQYVGDAVIVKIPQIHGGYTCTVPTEPNQTLPGEPFYLDKYYLINAPKNSTFEFKNERHSDKVLFKDLLKFHLKDANYLSICSLNGLEEAKYYHDHAYSFIQLAETHYEVNHESKMVTTTFRDNYSNVLGDNSVPNLCLMPHQYKNSDVALTDKVITSMRGKLKVMNGSTFDVEQSFIGMLPTNTLPKNSEFNNENMTRYLSSLDTNTNQTFGDVDENKVGPYWDAKTFYPLAQGMIFADQMKQDALKTKFINKAKNLLVDWFTYSGEEDKKYLYYNQKYATMYYSNDEFFTASQLSDHHFTHGYLLYTFSVLSMYDNQFYEDYKDIAKELLDDYMCTNRIDDKFPYFRTFDSWAGHSWAHGYGNFAEGNNQESSGEALNSWVGAYLYGLASENQSIIDGAIYGFTTELNAIKQYVFDYDHDIFKEDYANTVNISSIIWAGKNTYATWFGLNPNFVYGIHYLPIGEYVSGYAVDDDVESLRAIYQGYESKKAGFKDTWMANMWSVKSLFDPSGAIQDFSETKILNDDYPNDLPSAYWMINSSQYFGQRSSDYIIDSAFVGYDIYKDGSTYHVQLWNPTGRAQKVKISSRDNTVQKEVTVAANSFISETL